MAGAFAVVVVAGVDEEPPVVAEAVEALLDPLAAPCGWLVDPLPEAEAAPPLPCDDGAEELEPALFAACAFVVLDPEDGEDAAEPPPDEGAGALDAEAVDDDDEPSLLFELADDAVLDALPLGAALLLEAGWDWAGCAELLDCAPDVDELPELEALCGE